MSKVRVSIFGKNILNPELGKNENYPGIQNSEFCRVIGKIPGYDSGHGTFSRFDSEIVKVSVSRLGTWTNFLVLTIDQ